METLALSQMLSCSLRCSSLASLALTFLTVCDVLVKGSRVSPACHLVSHTKIKYTLGHIFTFIFGSFFNMQSRIFCLSLTPPGLRTYSKSVESCTRTVSSLITLAREYRRMHSMRVYSRRKETQDTRVRSPNQAGKNLVCSKIKLKKTKHIL